MENIESLKLVYITLIFLTFLHSIEEVIGKATFINTFYGNLVNYWLIHFLVFFVLIILFLFTLNDKKWYYSLNYFYAITMIIDGAYHIIAGITGGYTGIGLIIFGSLLIYLLWKNQKSPKLRKLL
mgnify:CR=1 FL=1